MVFHLSLTGNVCPVRAAEMSRGRIDAEVVIPLKWPAGDAQSYRVEEMAWYLRGLGQTVTSITVVDGSDAEAFDVHHRAWACYARVIRPDPGVRTNISSRDRSGGTTGGADSAEPLNGKVIGALTGIREARHEHVVLADDDVRHTRDTITRVVSALGEA